MIIKLSALLIPKSQSEAFLKRVTDSLHSDFENAPGLEAVLILKRHFVAYTEASVLSIWNSKEACESFERKRPIAISPSQDCIVEKDGYTYTVVATYHARSALNIPIYPEGADQPRHSPSLCWCRIK
jgi:hypothetical protein